MRGYFPYSQIISDFCANIKQTISRYSYTSAWQVFDNSSETSAPSSQCAISEIYY